MSSAFRYKPGAIVNSLKSTVTIITGEKTMKVVALWDTGATVCCISESVISDLSLVPNGKLRINTPSSEGELVNTYLVDLLLPNDISVKDVVVAQSKIGAQGIGLLVGMDIISRGDFLITNNKETVFSFRMPSEGVMDFVTGIKASNIINSNRNSNSKSKIRRKRK